MPNAAAHKSLDLLLCIFIYKQLCVKQDKKTPKKLSFREAGEDGGAWRSNLYSIPIPFFKPYAFE